MQDIKNSKYQDTPRCLVTTHVTKMTEWAFKFLLGRRKTTLTALSGRLQQGWCGQSRAPQGALQKKNTGVRPGVPREEMPDWLRCKPLSCSGEFNSERGFIPCMHNHARTHTHTCTHTRKNSYEHTRVQTRAYTSTLKDTRLHPHTKTRTHVHTHAKWPNRVQETKQKPSKARMTLLFSLSGLPSLWNPLPLYTTVTIPFPLPPGCLAPVPPLTPLVELGRVSMSSLGNVT